MMIMSDPNETRPLNILLVEDDDGDAKALKRAFEKARIANPIRRALDGIEALDVLKGENGQPKMPAPYILLVDLNMPRMNGIQLVEAIHRFHPHHLETRRRQRGRLQSQCHGLCC